MSEEFSLEEAVGNLTEDVKIFYEELTKEKNNNPEFNDVLYQKGIKLSAYCRQLGELIQSWEKSPNCEANDMHAKYSEFYYLFSNLMKRYKKLSEDFKSVECKLSDMTKLSDKVLVDLKLAQGAILNSKKRTQQGTQQLLSSAQQCPTRKWIENSSAETLMSFISKIMRVDNQPSSAVLSGTVTTGGNLLSILTDNLECQYDLLNSLIGRCLEVHHIEYINSGKVSLERNRTLLQLLNSTNIKDFLHALCQSNQRHLANFILAGGDREMCCSDDWPLDDQRKRWLTENFGDLVTDIYNEVMVNHLFSKSVISHAQMEGIKVVNTELIRNRELICLMVRRSIVHFEIFRALLNNPDCYCP